MENLESVPAAPPSAAVPPPLETEGRPSFKVDDSCCKDEIIRGRHPRAFVGQVLGIGSQHIRELDLIVYQANLTSAENV